MPKEKICDCGKPISQCECEGHNHKKAKNVKKGGVPDYLSIFGDRVQQYADYKRKKQEQYTPRSLYDPFGIVVDIGDDGGLSGTASFYKPGQSRGTAMTKKAKKQTPPPPPNPIDDVKDWVSALVGGANAAANAVIRDAQGKQLYDDKYKENPTGNIITDTVMNLVNSVANASDQAVRAAKDSVNARGHSIAGRRNGRSADEVRVYPSGGNWRNPKSEAGLEGVLNDIGRRINAGRNAIDEAIVRPVKRYNERAKQHDEDRKKKNADFNIRWHKDGPQRRDLTQQGDWIYIQAYEPRATPAYPSGGNWYDPESESGISGIVTNATRAINRMKGKPEKQTREGTSNRRSSYEENERNKHKKNKSGGKSINKRNSLSKANGPTPPFPLSYEAEPPRNPPYQGNVSSASDYVNYLLGDRIDPERPYSYYVGGPNERERNNAKFNVNQMAELADLMATPTPTSSNSSQRIKQDAWTPEYITNRVNAPTNSRRQFENVNLLTNQASNALSGFVDELSNQLDRYGRFITANTYNNTTGDPRSQVTPKYVSNKGTSNQYLDAYYDTVGKPRSQVTPDYVWNQVLGSQYDYDNTTGKPRSQVTPDYVWNHTPTSKNMGKSMKESRGSKMPKRKVQMCEDCGKPEFACKCKGHQGGRSMSKAMCKCGSGMSKAMCKCGGMGKSMHKAYNPPIPLPPLPGQLGNKMRDAAGDVYGTVMSFAGKIPGKMKNMLGLGNMHDIFKDSPMKLFGRMGKRGNINKTSPLPLPPPPDFDDLVDKLVDMLPGAGARQLMNSYQTGNLFADTPDYIDYLSPQKRLQPSAKIKQSRSPYDLFRGSPMKLKMNKRGSKVSKANVPPPPPLPDISDIFRSMSRENQKRGTSYNALPLLEQRRYNDPFRNQREYDDGTPDYINYLYPNSSKMNKRGKKVSKAWPFPDSEFERNGGKVGPQRRRGFLTVPEFGYESMEGYNPAENAVRQMMPTPSDVAAYDRNTKEQALASAFGDLMGAYGNELGASLGNEDWWYRTANRADRAANNTADTIASMFPEPKLGTPRGMNKRLAKSAKMSPDMGKAPQKVTPKRTIRHSDKYFK